MIRFACPGCQATFTVDDAKGGKAGTCPKCQARFLIPDAPEANGPPPVGPNEPVEVSPCPKCGTRLSVAASDIGVDVECPYCQTVFKASRPGFGSSPKKSGSEVRNLRESDINPAPRRRDEDLDEDRPRRRDEDLDEDRPRRRRDEELDEDRPRSRRRAEDDEEYDRSRRRSRRDEDDEEYEEERPRRRRGRSRRAAEEAVNAPATFLLVVGVLGILLGMFNVVRQATGMNDPNNNPFLNKQQLQQQRQQPGFDTGHAIGGWGAAVTSLIWAVVVVGGAIQMRNLRSYGFAMTAAVVVILPLCNLCCLLGIPAGIWSIVVLQRPEVKDAFT